MCCLTIWHLQRVTPAFRLIPNVDEAYTVPRGMEQIIDGMLQQVPDRVFVSHPVERMSDDGARISLRANGQTISAGHVFFAAPLHALSKIDVDVEGLSDMETA